MPAALLAAGGCADDTFDSISGFDRDHDIRLNLRLPAFAVPATRSVNADAIEDVRLYFYGADGLIGDPETLTADDLTPPAGTVKEYTATVLVPAGTTLIKLAGNYTALGLGEQMLLSGDPNTKDVVAFWGEQSLAGLDSYVLDIDMTRSLAKTSFSVDPAVDDFTLLETYFYGNPSQGYANYVTPNTLNIPSTAVYASAGVKTDTPCYHYEAQPGNCFWVIKGSYQGVEGWYKLGYILKDAPSGDPAESQEGTEIGITRNHHYEFVIEGVNHTGFDTREEAAAAPFGNSLRARLNDHEENIYDLVQCGDYYLGVQDKVEVAASASEAVFEVVTNYPDGLLAKHISVVEDEGGHSLVSDTNPITVEEIGTQGGSQTSGRRYKVTVPVAENLASNEDNHIIMLVHVGDLTRNVDIVQLGAEFFSGDDRVSVGLKGMNDATVFNAYNFLENTDMPDVMRTGSVIDYFGWLSDTGEYALKGESAEEMGVERGEGLHFPVYMQPGASDWEYIIPNAKTVLSPDAYKCTVKTGGEYFEVVPSADMTYYTVRLKEAGKVNYRLWTGSVVYEGNGRTVELDVYHTGIVHYLDGATCQMPDQNGVVAKGWYYYEQVDVTGRDGETYHILDRNIGASSNKAFLYNGSFDNSDERARGAYFYVPGRNGMEGLEGVLPVGYREIPTRYHLDYMNIDPNPVVPQWTTSGASAVRTIYLPVAGAMEGDALIDDAHAYCWSSSMIMGSQGFFEGDAEYGYWYRALDIYGKAKSVTPVRIASRATGARHGMPVRAMCGPASVLGYDLPKVVEGRCRIILDNEAGWEGAKAMFNGDSNYTRDLVKGDGEGSWFYVDLKGEVSKVKFYYGTASTDEMTVTYAGTEVSERIATFSNAGVTPPAPDTRDAVTVIMKNGANWSETDPANIHLFNASTKVVYSGAWPGLSMRKVTYNGENCYRIDLKLSELANNPSKFADMNFTLNKGGDAWKSEDMTAFSQNTEALCFVFNNSGVTFERALTNVPETVEGWQGVVVDPEPDLTGDYYTLYVKDCREVAANRIYYWGGSHPCANWDSSVSYESSYSSNSVEWRVFKLPKDCTGVIVHSGAGAQTENFEGDALGSLKSSRKQNQRVELYYENNKTYIRYLGPGKP